MSDDLNRAFDELLDELRLTAETLRAHCNGTLAGYKQPRKLFIEGEIRRSPAGKADYRWARAVASDAMGGLS